MLKHQEGVENMEDLSILQIIKLILPLIAIDLSLKVWCMYLIIKHGVKTLSKPAWAGIVLLIQLLGPLGFLIFGKNHTS